MLILRNYVYKQFFFLKQYKKLHNLVVGDLIRVSTLEKEKKTNKTKSFIGVCILKKRYSLGIKIVLKKIIKNNYIEKSFLLYSPSIFNIEILSTSKSKK